MLEQLPAIGGVCVDTDAPSIDGLVGTAFALSDTDALTAFHCVGNRSTGEVEQPKPAIWLGDRFTAATVIEYCVELDVAILELQGELPGHLKPVRLTAAADVGAEFLSVGWPTSRPFTPHYMSVSGTVVNPHSKIFEKSPAIQLHCVQSASMALAGFSGAPVLINDGPDMAALGLIRWNPERHDIPQFAVGGTVYASPSSAIMERYPRLNCYAAGPPTDKQNSHGYCICHSKADEDVADWLGEFLESKGIDVLVRHEYVMGTNFMRAIAEAHRTHPNIIVLLSQDTFQCDSPSHRAELRRLQEGYVGGELIPVRLEHVEMPTFLSHIEPTDLYGRESEQQVEALLLARLDPEKAPPRLPARFPTERFIKPRQQSVSRNRLPKVSLESPGDERGGS
ncbi:TIR domain-containing protein [Phytohabitans aurantiacus]|uniref:TIR domain-containing protein n=1 Tax=Phytohabitans aurantiacus TaxID=3016789 RepID=A0ABQ5RB13_9ACTN|nr:TIR domain-containing protein [Phytohabitans aurantiacus]GLI03932.1 hypothetical protein Pa4123_92130 [Phytohabitans aurantiacus]